MRCWISNWIIFALIQNDVENGIVYPEVYPIIYFDPYLQEFDSNNKEILEENGDDFNQQESDFEALHRLTALMHETFIENQLSYTPNDCAVLWEKMEEILWERVEQNHF